MRSISMDIWPTALKRAGASIVFGDTSTFVTLSPRISCMASKSFLFSSVASSATFFSSSLARSMSLVETFFSSFSCHVRID